MAQWERIVALHQVFKRSRSYRAYSDLMREIDCSRATLFRLLDKMQNAFRAPIERSRKYGGSRYSKDGKNYELPALLINSGEIEALVCLEHIVKGLSDGVLSDLLKPLRSRIEPFLHSQKVQPEDFYKKIKIVSIAGRQVDKKVFATIAEAILHTRQIRISYCKFGAPAASDRVVSPQTMLRYRDNWYLDAFCHTAKHLRTFALNRIGSAALLKCKSIALPRDELDNYFGASYGIFSGPVRSTAQILFTGLAAHEVALEQWHPNQKCSINLDGSSLLEIPYSDSRELIMDILRWGDKAEVLGPIALREEIARIAENLGKIYKEKRSVS